MTLTLLATFAEMSNAELEKTLRGLGLNVMPY
jgi:hypothetical protein